MITVKKCRLPPISSFEVNHFHLAAKRLDASGHASGPDPSWRDPDLLSIQDGISLVAMSGPVIRKWIEGYHYQFKFVVESLAPVLADFSTLHLMLGLLKFLQTGSIFGGAL
jgi:hypothetical protein